MKPPFSYRFSTVMLVITRGCQGTRHDHPSSSVLAGHPQGGRAVFLSVLAGAVGNRSGEIGRIQQGYHGKNCRDAYEIWINIMETYETYWAFLFIFGRTLVFLRAILTHVHCWTLTYPARLLFGEEWKPPVSLHMQIYDMICNRKGGCTIPMFESCNRFIPVVSEIDVLLWLQNFTPNFDSITFW